MGVRVVNEVERSEGSRARAHFHFLDAQEDEHRPYEVCKLGREEQGPQRYGGCDFLGGKSKREVADENELCSCRDG
jgi:hypothetical protein